MKKNKSLLLTTVLSLALLTSCGEKKKIQLKWMETFMLKV